MASMQHFDQEIAKTKAQVEEMRGRIEQSGSVLETLAKADKSIGSADFDIENARIEDVVKQQKVMEANIADLIIGLEDATNVFGTEFESMKSYTGWESVVGVFSEQAKQRMRTDRVRNMSLAGNLQELLSKSDTIVGILKAQKQVLDARYKTSEASLAQVIERRKATMENLTSTQKRIEELNPLLLDIENKIAASTNQKERTQLEGDRSKLATEYNERQAKEQELLAESQTLERYTSMFQTFVDSLNNQIAAQNTLINKLTIDTEQRIVLYKALEDSLEDGRPAGRRPQDQHARQPGRHHRRGDHGRHRRSRPEAHRRPIGNAREEHGRHRGHPAPQEARRRRVRPPFRRGYAQAQLRRLRGRDLIRPEMPDSASSPLAGAAPAADPAERYFAAIAAALEGLNIFMRDDRSPLYRHDLVAKIVSGYIGRLETSFSCWRNRLGFMEHFQISRAELGFPVFQNVLELENDRRQAPERLANIPEPDTLRAEMADFILRHKEFPAALQRSMAERLYLEDIKDGDIFGPFMLAETAAVSVNPKTMRPYYVVHWATFDGSANLPLIYMATIEDSSEEMVSQLVDDSGKLDETVKIPLPVEGLLNPELAHRFDDFTEKNSAYSLSPVTIAGNLDKDFETLHPEAAAADRARSLLFERHHGEQFEGGRRALQGAAAGERMAAHLDPAGGVLASPRNPAAEACGRATRRRRSSTSTPTTWRRRGRACRATRSTR